MGKIWTVGTLRYTTGALLVLFFWLLWGDFAWSMRERSVPPVIQLLFKHFGASDLLVGLLTTSLPALLALLIGPVIGYWSDRHRGPWGRRIPFLFIPTPIAVAAMVGLAFSPTLGELWHRHFGDPSSGVGSSALVFLGLFWVLFETASIMANLLFGSLVNDVVPQEVLGRFFAMFRALSLIAGIIFNFWMLGVAETHYVSIFLGLGLLYGLGFTIMCLKVKEGDYPPVEASASQKVAFLSVMKTWFKDCFGNSYYRWYFGAMALAGIAGGPLNAFSLFYAKSLQMEMTAYGKCIAITYAISLVLAYPLGVLADRFHPLRVSLVAVALYAGVMMWSILYCHDARTFSFALIAHGVVCGMFFTASASLGQRLLLRSRFAELNSASVIASCLASVAMAPVVGIFLDSMGHAYRYLFPMGFILSLLALGALLIVHAKFMALGGPHDYQAPA